VVVAEELEQVDAGQVARRVIEVDVLAAISYYGATHDVGVVPRLGEVVGGLESLRHTADHANGAVDLIEARLLDDLGQLGLLAGEAEADEPVELSDGSCSDAQVIRRP